MIRQKPFKKLVASYPFKSPARQSARVTLATWVDKVHSNLLGKVTFFSIHAPPVTGKPEFYA